LRDIQDAREAKHGKPAEVEKIKKTVSDDIKTEIKNNVSKRPTWESFIQDIKCNY
jgi:hypothetical protein